uniref:Mitochondrial S-adenosylmethionine carrier protein n=1 Tax=Pavo cristatus TaxID=9049 RepID=A0A8C9G2D5_PAVCR
SVTFKGTYIFLFIQFFFRKHIALRTNTSAPYKQLLSSTRIITKNISQFLRFLYWEQTPDVSVKDRKRQQKKLQSEHVVLLQVACLIRVPSEVVKQRAQVSPSAGTFRILSHTLYHEGIQGLYRGYKSTVLREVNTLVFFKH